MLEISDVYKQKIIDELIENTLVIEFPDNDIDPITEENIVSESMALKQSICDEEKLKFGGCIASEFSIQLLNTAERSFDNVKLKNKKIKVILTQEHPTGQELLCSDSTICGDTTLPGEIITKTEWVLFVGKIDSAKRSQDDRNIFEVVAYDVFSKLHEKAITGKLHKVLKTDGITKIAPYSDLLALCVNKVAYNPDDFNCAYSLGNSAWFADRESITKGQLLRNLCEIVGGFGVFKPSEDQIRFIKAGESTETYDFYESLTVSENPENIFQGVLFPYGGEIDDNENDITENKTAFYNGTLSLEEDVELEDYVYYDITDNIIAWDYSSSSSGSSLQVITGFFNSILANVTYTPYTATVDGRPWVEVGDNVVFKIPKTNIYGEWLDENREPTEDINSIAYEEITSIVMSRTLTGIKALTDQLEAKGEI